MGAPERERVPPLKYKSPAKISRQRRAGGQVKIKVSPIRPRLPATEADQPPKWPLRNDPKSDRFHAQKWPITRPKSDRFHAQKWPITRPKSDRFRTRKTTPKRATETKKTGAHTPSQATSHPEENNPRVGAAAGRPRSQATPHPEPDQNSALQVPIAMPRTSPRPSLLSNRCELTT